jgi:hypothetical protein
MMTYPTPRPQPCIHILLATSTAPMPGTCPRACHPLCVPQTPPHAPSMLRGATTKAPQREQHHQYKPISTTRLGEACAQQGIAVMAQLARGGGSAGTRVIDAVTDTYHRQPASHPYMLAGGQARRNRNPLSWWQSRPGARRPCSLREVRQGCMKLGVNLLLDRGSLQPMMEHDGIQPWCSTQWHGGCKQYMIMNKHQYIIRWRMHT